VHAQYKMTTEVMLDDQKVHEMVIVALERDWAVIDKHVDSIHDLFAEVIRQGIEAGEFRDQDPVIASRCFGAATVILCHPQMVAQCLAKTNRAMPDDLIDYAIKALK
ncbi:TetR/AcrR family transcriptional regulator, partial [Mesorhizobium sp. M4B.F.Ca.ET.013.02.1.1]